MSTLEDGYTWMVERQTKDYGWEPYIIAKTRKIAREYVKAGKKYIYLRVKRWERSFYQ